MDVIYKKSNQGRSLSWTFCQTTLRNGPSDFDMEVETSQSRIDVESIAWEQDTRQEAIKLIMGSKK